MPAPDIGLSVRAYVQVRAAVCEDEDATELLLGSIEEDNATELLLGAIEEDKATELLLDSFDDEKVAELLLIEPIEELEDDDSAELMLTSLEEEDATELLLGGLDEDITIELERSVSEELDDCSSLDDEINPVALGAFSEQAEKSRTMPKKVE